MSPVTAPARMSTDTSLTATLPPKRTTTPVVSSRTSGVDMLGVLLRVVVEVGCRRGRWSRRPVPGRQAELPVEVLAVALGVGRVDAHPLDARLLPVGEVLGRQH